MVARVRYSDEERFGGLRAAALGLALAREPDPSPPPGLCTVACERSSFSRAGESPGHAGWRAYRVPAGGYPRMACDRGPVDRSGTHQTWPSLASGDPDARTWADAEFLVALVRRDEGHAAAFGGDREPRRYDVLHGVAAVLMIAGQRASGAESWSAGDALEGAALRAAMERDEVLRRRAAGDVT